MTAPDLMVTDPRTRKLEAIGTKIVEATLRWQEERESRCSDPQTIAFWQCEVSRLGDEFAAELEAERTS